MWFGDAATATVVKSTEHWTSLVGSGLSVASVLLYLFCFLIILCSFGVAVYAVSWICGGMVCDRACATVPLVGASEGAWVVHVPAGADAAEAAAPGGGGPVPGAPVRGSHALVTGTRSTYGGDDDDDDVHSVRSVHDVYERERRPAQELEKERAALLQRAEQARQSGNKKLHRQLTNDAAALSRRVECLQAAAMRSIAAAVNSPRWLALQLDLRGLHASEVPQLIDSQLKPQKVVRRLSEEDKDDEDEDDDSSDDSDDSAVGGEAALLLLPAARSHLEQLGLEVEQQGPGALVVHLRK